MRREAQQRQEICRYPKHQPCRCQRRHLWAAPTLRRCRGSGRPPRSQSHVLHTALNPAARVESAQTRKARSLSERFRNDWICRANLTRQSDQVTSSAKRLISAIGAGIPRHLCARQVPASTWLCGNDNHSSSTQCGCVAVCPIGDIVPVVTAKAGSRAFLLSRIGHPAYIRTSALRVLSNARAP